jgi:sodium pump decarboxylase gamma subunit
MSVTEELARGLELTLTGMVTVFILLTFMVLIIQWMSKLAHRLQPPKQSFPLHSPNAHPGALNPTLVSAIGAAVHRYRNSLTRNPSRQIQVKPGITGV